MKIEIAIQTLMIEKQLTLCLAESCTGGNIARQLTQVPGCSPYFLGSLVTYSNELKTKVLGVNAQSLQTFGAVSKEIAQEMLQGLFEKTPCDIGMAVTGIAGPDGGSAQKPVGLIYAAIGQPKGNIVSIQFNLEGSRSFIIQRTTNLLLSQLYKYVLFLKNT